MNIAKDITNYLPEVCCIYDYPLSRATERRAKRPRKEKAKCPDLQENSLGGIAEESPGSPGENTCRVN